MERFERHLKSYQYHLDKGEAMSRLSQFERALGMYKVALSELRKAKEYVLTSDDILDLTRDDHEFTKWLNNKIKNVESRYDSLKDFITDFEKRLSNSLPVAPKTKSNAKKQNGGKNTDLTEKTMALLYKLRGRYDLDDESRKEFDRIMKEYYTTTR